MVTKTGCTVSVVHQGYEHLGTGVMLMLDMKQPGDGRHAEVYLDSEIVEWLRKNL